MADTWGPYHAAYVIVAVVYAGYAGSIWWRARRAARRLRGRESDPSLRSG